MDLTRISRANDVPPSQRLILVINVQALTAANVLLRTQGFRAMVTKPGEFQYGPALELVNLWSQGVAYQRFMEEALKRLIEPELEGWSLVELVLCVQGVVQGLRGSSPL